MRPRQRIFLTALLLLTTAGLAFALWVEAAGSPGERAFRARGCAFCHPAFEGRPLRVLADRKPGEALRPRVEEALAGEHPTLSAGATEELIDYILPQQYAALAAAQAGQQGERLYLAKCAACHGRGGEGQPGAYPPLLHSEWLRDADKLARLPEILQQGLREPIMVKGERWDAIMNAPGLQGADEREAVMRYVRERFAP